MDEPLFVQQNVLFLSLSKLVGPIFHQTIVIWVPFFASLTHFQVLQRLSYVNTYKMKSSVYKVILKFTAKRENFNTENYGQFLENIVDCVYNIQKYNNSKNNNKKKKNNNNNNKNNNKKKNALKQVIK